MEDEDTLARALIDLLKHPEKQQDLRDAAASITSAVDVGALADTLLELMDRR